MSNNKIVPFGKYKGQSLTVLQQDQSYLDWCAGQEGIKERYPWIFSITVNNGAEPAETPEHNKYQALFLDEDFAARFFDFARPGARAKEAKIYAGDKTPCMGVTVRFEARRRDIDRFGRGSERMYGPADVEITTYYGGSMRIEIKPSMGDDYPAVLRQMEANLCSTLYLVQYTGFGATLSQVKKMFHLAGIRVVMHYDFVDPF